MIGIIVAMKDEARVILGGAAEKETQTISGIEFTKCKLCGREIVLAICGVGKVFAAVCAQTMIMLYKPERIINCGVAGALRRGLAIGDVVVASSAVQYDMDTSPLGDPPGLVSGINIVDFPLERPDIDEITLQNGKTVKLLCGKIATGDKFISDVENKDRISGQFGADICEMEGCAIAQVCYINSLPCTIIRTVSDTFEGAENDYNVFMKYAADISGRVLQKMLYKFSLCSQ